MQPMELLAPAGNMDKLKAALLYGADAVYLGGKSFGLRAFSDNFSPEEMEAAIAYAHERGKRVYVTVNIFPHHRDLPGLPAYLRQLRDFHADAVLVADPGIFGMARETVPDLPIHISTQANTTNWAAVKFWYEQGASRVVMAREVGLSDIKEIHDRGGIGRVCTWRHVYFVFRALSVKQLFYTKQRLQPRSMRAMLSL